MESNISINIKYTKSDLKQLAKDKLLNNVYKKLFLISAYIFAGVYFLVILYIIIFGTHNKNILYNSPLIILFPAIFTSIIYIPFYQKYHLLKINFKKNHLLDNETILTVGENITITIKNKTYLYEWSDFLYVDDLKNNIILYYSEGIFLLIPRRCFLSQEVMDIFYNKLLINKPTWANNLKKYKINYPCPDFFESDFKLNSEVLMSSFDINFFHISSYYFNLFYKSGFGKLITTIGIIFLSVGILNFINGKKMFLIEGITILTLIPIFIILRSLLIYNGLPYKKNLNYIFYMKYFIYKNEYESSKIYFLDIEKYVEYNNVIIIEMYNKDIHIIPKNSLNNNKNHFSVLIRLLDANHKRNLKD